MVGEADLSPMEKRRTRYDIYADMIEVIAKKGLCSLTRVSYGSNLPVDRAKKMLQFLVSHGFIKEVNVGDKRKYRATKWGLEYLETYKRMERFFAALQQPMTLKTPDVVLPGRVGTGYRYLDNLLLGGIPQNYSVVLTSPSCDEKDQIVKGFLGKGVAERQITLHATVDATIARTIMQQSPPTFYLIICNPQAKKLVKDSPTVFRLKGVENITDINIAFSSAFRRLGKSPKESKRACIEIVSDILLLHQAVQTRRWLLGLLPQLKERGFTTMVIINPYMHSPRDVHAILGLFDGEMNIYEKETPAGLRKFLKVRKMYNQRYLEDKLLLGKEVSEKRE